MAELFQLSRTVMFDRKTDSCWYYHPIGYRIALATKANLPSK